MFEAKTSFVTNPHLLSEFNFSDLEVYYVVPTGKDDKQRESSLLNHSHGSNQAHLVRTGIAKGKVQSLLDFFDVQTDDQALSKTASTIGSTAAGTLGNHLGNLMTGTDSHQYRLIPASSSTMLLKSDKPHVSEGVPPCTTYIKKDCSSSQESEVFDSTNYPKTFLLMRGRNRRDYFAVIPYASCQRLPLNSLSHSLSCQNNKVSK